MATEPCAVFFGRPRMELIKDLGTRLYSGKKSRFGLFLCSVCGAVVERQTVSAIKQKTCGCIWGNYRHGMDLQNKRSPLYRTWEAMKARCLNPNNNRFRRYGMRGIKVCSEWMVFDVFMKWAIENQYKEGLTLDRIDFNGNYSPTNCQFLTRSENTKKAAIDRAFCSSRHASQHSHMMEEGEEDQ